MLLTPALGLTALVFGAAMAILVSYSAYTFRGGRLTEEVSFSAWGKFFGEPFYWGIVAETFRLGFGVTAVALLIGFPTAYALTKIRSQRLLLFAYIVIFSPLLVSVVVRAYGWLLLLSDGGVINETLLAVGVIETPIRMIFNQFGVTIALVHILLPFMVFPILSVLLQFDATLREAAMDLGANRWQTFVRVILPLSLPGMLAGAQIVFTLAISAFVTPSLLGGGKIQVLARHIFVNVTDVNWPLAAVEAIVLLAMALAALAAFNIAGRAIQASRAAGAGRRQELPRRPDPIYAALYALLALVLAYMLAPLVIVVINSFNESAFSRFPPTGWSLRWYETVLSYAPFRDGMRNSLLIAGLSTAIVVPVGMMAALALVRSRIPLREVVRAFLLSPLIVPKVAVGIAVFILFIRLRVFGTMPSIVAAHAMLTLPFTIVLLTANLVGVNRTLEEAAMDLGAGPLRTFWKVTLPQMRAGLIVSAVFAFIVSFDETETTIFLVRPENTTLPIQMFLYIEQHQDPTLAALSTVLIVITAVVVFLTMRAVRGAEVARIISRR